MLNDIKKEVEAAEERIKEVRIKLKGIHHMLKRNGYQLSADQCEMIDKTIQDIYGDLDGSFIDA